jgi:hypothetical protein
MAVKILNTSPIHRAIVKPGTISASGTVDEQVSVTATLTAHRTRAVILPSSTSPVNTNNAWNFTFQNVNVADDYDLTVTGVSPTTGTGVSIITITVQSKGPP